MKPQVHKGFKNRKLLKATISGRPHYILTPIIPEPGRRYPFDDRLKGTPGQHHYWTKLKK